MENVQRRVAKVHLAQAMLQGRAFREAVHEAGIQVSRATAYRLRQVVMTRGAEALRDGSAGHPTKVRSAIRTWLEGLARVLPCRSCR
jgi:hypothetical protein